MPQQLCLVTDAPILSVTGGLYFPEGAQVGPFLSRCSAVAGPAFLLQDKQRLFHRFRKVPSQWHCV